MARARIARVRLARSAAGLMAQPAAAIVAGSLAAAASLVVGGPAGILLSLAGWLAIVLGLVLLLVLLSVRVDVDADGVRVASLLGARRHRLIQGPITRCAITGPEAVPLRARVGGRAWALGPATLRGDERIAVVRLAPVDSLVLVPAEGGRLAIAPASEEALLAALARVERAELDAAAPEASTPRAPTAAAPEAAPEPVERMEGPPRLLTGIERSMVLQLLEAARYEDEAAGSVTAVAPAGGGVLEALGASGAAPGQAVPRRGRLAWWPFRRAASGEPEAACRADVAPAPRVGAGETELHAVQVAAAPWTEPIALGGEPAAPPAAAPAAPVRQRGEPGRVRQAVDRLLARPPRSRLIGIAVVALPLALTVAAWYGAAALGTLPSSPEGRRSVALALLLIGPAVSLAAMVVRITSPRLIGLVVVSSLVGFTMAVRALLP